MFMLAKFVDMIALFGGFQCQQLEWAIGPLSTIAVETNSLMFFSPCSEFALS
jgi:hypothetical protein